jgi:hypothetical protein
VIAILSGIIWTGWGGFALAKLWGWFVVPLGVPSIIWWQAAGLITIFALLSQGTVGYAAISARTGMGLDDKAQKWLLLVVAASLPGLALASGWLVKTLGPIVDAAL